MIVRVSKNNVLLPNYNRGNRFNASIVPMNLEYEPYERYGNGNYIWDGPEDETEDSDPESREIDYPDTPDPTDDDESTDDSVTMLDHLYRYDYPMQPPPSIPSTPSTFKVECSVCCGNYQSNGWKWTDLDHYFVGTVGTEMAFQSSCGIHYICFTCLKKSLLTNTEGLLRRGNGNVPCLGDIDCKIGGSRHPSTMHLDSLRDVFTPDEWETIRIVKNRVVAQSQVPRPHPFINPLQTTNTVTAEEVVEWIKNILQQDTVRVKCPVCSVHISKSTACNSLRHCDWEVCWICGYQDRRLKGDHWNQCPHFDRDPYWEKLGYMCKEDECFTEDRECRHPSHQSGLYAMNEMRRAFQVSKLFNYIGEDMRKVVKRKMKHNPSLNTAFLTCLQKASQFPYRPCVQ
jgi:hypothetical protein